MRPGETTARRQFLTFTLAGEPFALEIGLVREIIGYEPPTRVPSSPAQVRGVINLRGTVIPVLDLAVRFGAPPTPVGKRTCILVANAKLAGETATLGVVVDAIRDVLEIADADVEPAPSIGARVPPELLIGLAREDGHILHLLDLQRALEEGAALTPNAPSPIPASASWR